MLGVEDLKAGRRWVGGAGGAMEAEKEDHPTVSSVWPLALDDCRLHGTMGSPHFLPCHAHVHFGAQITVPKVTWN